MIVKSSSMVFGFAFSYVLARIWGAETLGFYILYITVLNILIIAVKLGQDRYVLKTLAIGQEDRNSIIINSLSLILIASVSIAFLTTLAFFFEVFTPPSELSVFVYVSSLFLSLLGGGGIAVIIAILRGGNDVTKANILDGIPLNICLFLMVLIGFLLNINGQFVYLILSHGVLSAALFLILFLKYIPCRNGFNVLGISSLKNHFHLGLPFTFITGATVLNNSIDTLSINHFLSLNDIAFYNVAQKLSSLVQFSLVIGASLVANKFAEFYASNQKRQLTTLLVTLTKVVSFLGLLVFLTMCIFSNEILSLWGENFIFAQSSLYILCTGQLINVFFGPLGILLTMAGYEKKVLWSTIMVLVINFSANYVLVPLYGIEGAAISTASAIIIQNCIFFIIIKKNRVLGDNND